MIAFRPRSSSATKSIPGGGVVAESQYTTLLLHQLAVGVGWCRLVSAVCEGRRKIGVIPCSMVLTQTRTASLRDPNKFPTTQLFLLGRCCITSSQRSDHYALIPVPKQHWYDSQSQSPSHRYSLGHGNSFSTSMLETRAMRPFTPGFSSRQCLSPKLFSASKCCDPHHKRDSCAECVASGVV